MEVKLIEGGMHVDERGIVSFVNNFDFQGVDRFYIVKAHNTGQIRGWFGHKHEHKWFAALAGTIIVAVAVPDNWENPSKDLPIRRFTLAALKPAILHVPPGHATASIMLTDDALLGVFSSGKIENAFDDDWRFKAEMWEVQTKG